MGDEAGWCTIESDPGVFTELLRSIGVKNVQVDEIYALDRDELARHGRVYGLVFLFKYRDNERESARTRPGRVVAAPEDLFFANQTIRNACATQAILSIVLNAPCIAIGDELTQFKEFSHGMDAMTRGMVISNSDTIREAHNSFSGQQALEVDDSSGEKEDPFHFVAYIPWQGKVYELDGLQEGPRELGVASDAEWLDVVAPLLTGRMQEYGESEIRFNLMVVVEDPREKLQTELDKLRGEGDAADVMRVSEIEAELQTQKEKHQRWEVEIARRRWNFMPLIFGLLKTLANAGQVEGVIKAAEKRKTEAFREAMAKKAKEEQS